MLSLSFLIKILFAGLVILLFIPAKEKKILKQVALATSFTAFVYSLLFWLNFDNLEPNFQYIEQFIWIEGTNINFYLALDGISLFFIILSTFLIPLCLLGSWNVIEQNVKSYLAFFLLMEIALIFVFSVLDVLLFYIFFESILIPMFLIIGIWGTRSRKIRASYLFFLYTLVGSVLMLLAIFYIIEETGTTDFNVISNYCFDTNIQKILWIAFFCAFAAKIPMVPLHLWLTEAHVEAPTAGSVILAGVLLKLGTYGFLRFSFPLFPVATFYFTPLMLTLASIGTVYTSLTAIRQTDVKRVVAYASIAHMNVVLIGMFSLNTQGIEGSIFQMLSHGIVAAALFFSIGVMYDRYHSRLIKYYSGLVFSMPIFMTFFLLFTMGNIALPGTSSFVGEFLILAGIIQTNYVATFIGASGMVLGGAYSLWLFNRVAFGNLKTQYVFRFSDINRREFSYFFPLLFLMLLLGLYPDLFLEPMHLSVSLLIEHIHLNS